jgi:hypothetical protein
MSLGGNVQVAKHEAHGSIVNHPGPENPPYYLASSGRLVVHSNARFLYLADSWRVSLRHLRAAPARSLGANRFAIRRANANL